MSAPDAPRTSAEEPRDTRTMRARCYTCFRVSILTPEQQLAWPAVFCPLPSLRPCDTRPGAAPMPCGGRVRLLGFGDEEAPPAAGTPRERAAGFVARVRAERLLEQGADTLYCGTLYEAGRDLAAALALLAELAAGAEGSRDA